MAKNYDVVVVGAGTAGQTAAYELNANGMKVALVEHSDRPGGTCALSGCQAKKYFYEGTKAVACTRDLEGMGIVSPAVASWAQLLREKNRFTESIPQNTVSGLRDSGIDFIEGRAGFLDPQAIAVKQDRLEAHYFVLATGAVPMKLPIEGHELMTTSSEFLQLEDLPGQIVFVGGGFISFEFAHFAARLGRPKTRCTILEAAPRPLAPFDSEMVDHLVAVSAEEGIDVHCDVDITAVEKTDRKFRILTREGPDFEADLVVNGAGRSPDIEQLHLDKALIDSSRRGIQVDRGMATSNPKVYAIGDCAATLQLARVADAEAHVAVENILSREKGRRPDSAMDYAAVPSVLFTYPQYAMVGATESELEGRGIDFKRSCDKNLTWPTYSRVGMKTAAYKLLAGTDGTLLGAHILSDDTTGLINACMLAMTNGIPVEKLYRQSVTTPYPSRESDIIYMLKPLLD